MSAMQVFFEGNVQGVGFRYSIRHIAKGFEVTGWVRNLRDGRVEMQVGGEDGEVRAFLEAIAQSELRPHIRKQDVTPMAEPPQARGFEIRYD
jgi:acylphosphatase